MIQEKEIQQIYSQVKSVIQYSQNIDNPNIDNLISEWFKNKKDFIDLMGGQLIYEFPEKVSFSLSERTRHNRVVDFIESVQYHWSNNELADFIKNQECGFFNNLTTIDYTTQNGKIIKKGNKLVRSFKYFVPDERCLTDIQNEASRIIQEDKMEGTLCVSVHPLDFLSSSETTYRWRSCHSLDGEYRAGNLSYMMDSTTVICYLKGEENAKLPNFPEEILWNSKKWRVLLFFSQDRNLLFAGRQYPFETSSGIDFILKNLLPKSNLIYSSKSWEKWSDWNNLQKDFSIKSDNETIDLNFNSPLLPIGQNLVPIRQIVSNAPGSKQYNDLLYSSCYKPLYATKIRDGLVGTYLPTSEKESKVILGHTTKCLHCGEEEIIEGGDTMLCVDCELKYGNANSDLFTACDCCGERIYIDDAILVQDEMFCPYCYENYCKSCDCCGEIFHEDLIKYDENTNEYLCPTCYDERYE